MQVARSGHGAFDWVPGQPHHRRRSPVSRGEYLQLLSEKTALERMIAETPKEDVLDRASLSARLRRVEEALSHAKPDEFADSAAEADRRALDQVRTFPEVLADK